MFRGHHMADLRENSLGPLFIANSGLPGIYINKWDSKLIKQFHNEGCTRKSLPRFVANPHIVPKYNSSRMRNGIRNFVLIHIKPGVYLRGQDSLIF